MLCVHFENYSPFSIHILLLHIFPNNKWPSTARWRAQIEAITLIYFHSSFMIRKLQVSNRSSTKSHLNDQKGADRQSHRRRRRRQSKREHAKHGANEIKWQRSYMEAVLGTTIALWSHRRPTYRPSYRISINRCCPRRYHRRQYIRTHLPHITINVTDQISSAIISSMPHSPRHRSFHRRKSMHRQSQSRRNNCRHNCR